MSLKQITQLDSKTGYFTTYFIDENGQKQGIFTESCDKGPRKICYYKNNALDGEYITFYYGQVFQKNRYKNGELSGLQEYFYYTGKLETSIFFKNGKPHGLQKIYDRWGKLIKVQSFINGQKITAPFRSKKIKKASCKINKIIRQRIR